MYCRLGIWHIDLITKSRPGDNCHGWSDPIPWMVTHHLKDKDGHSASPVWSPISLRLVTHYSIAPSQILSQASQGWSPTIPSMITHHPWNGHLSAFGWSPIIQYHLPKYCHPVSQGWSPTIPSMFNHHPKLLKFDKTIQNYFNLIKPSDSN